MEKQGFPRKCTSPYYATVVKQPVRRTGRICYALFMEYPFHEMKPFGFMDWAEMGFPESMRPFHGLSKEWAALRNSITFRGTKSEQHSVPWNKERVPRNGLFIGMPYSWTAQSMERRSRSCAAHKPPPPPPHSSSSSSERRVSKRQRPNYAFPRLQPRYAAATYLHAGSPC